MTKVTQTAITFMLIMGLGVALLGYLGSVYHPETPIKASSVAVEPQSVYISIETLLDAIEQVESGGISDKVGDSGRAIGAYQIWKIYVDDANRILTLQGKGKRYTYEDRWDKGKSREMTAIVIQHYGKGDIETMARAHNCPPKRYSESTKKYWLKIKNYLDNLQ